MQDKNTWMDKIKVMAGLQSFEKADISLKPFKSL